MDREAFHIEYEREEDGRWIAEISEPPGVMVYGADRAEAREAVKALALRVLADRVEGRESVPPAVRDLFHDAAE